MKKVIVLGAGYAGVLTAKKLAKKIKKAKKRVEVTLIDRNSFHTMLTELHEVAAGRVDEDSIRIDLDKVFAGRDVKVVRDEITAVSKNKLIGHDATYDYDYLVMAAGSKPNFFGINGTKENCFTLWSYDDAVRLREHILSMFRKATAESDPGKKRELLSFCVIGTGLTGVEMVGELAEYVPILCDRFDVDRSLVSITSVDMLDRVCTAMPEKVSAKILARLEKMGVEVMFKTGVKNVSGERIDYACDGVAGSIATRTVIWTAGITCVGVLPPEALLGNQGRIETNDYLQSVTAENIYVAGDNIHYVPEGSKAPVPQMVENAEQSADVVVHNLMTDLTGSGKKEKYAPKFHGAMVCVGGRWGAAHVGLPGRFFTLPSFPAMLSKHFINVVYFIQVLGWHKVFAYTKREFLTIRNRRSFLGGHFSNRGPTFLLVPLRLFLGFIWLYEGIKKVTEGWLDKPMMNDFVTGARVWYEGILAEAAGSGAAEAVASATPVTGGGGGGSVLIDWTVFGIFRPLLVGPPQEAFFLQVTPVDWMLNTLVLPNDGIQLIMQMLVVAAEILIGLALMGGLFTTIAGAASLGLQAMFLTSTGLFMSTWWMVPASVAVMFGAGLVFGLDYYVSPWLKRKWRGTRFARKWYLYHE